MRRDPTPTLAEAAAITAAILTAAGQATEPGADPVTAVASVREVLAGMWPEVPPEAARDALTAGAVLAWRNGVREIPAAVADQTATWLLEMTGEAEAGPADPGAGWMSPAMAFASSVAFDRDEDTETLVSLAVVLAVAAISAPEDPAARLRRFHGVNGELVAVHPDEDGVMIRADFHGSKLSASAARELAAHLIACADLADAWIRDASGPGPLSPSPWGQDEPGRDDDPDEPTNRDFEPEPDDYDPGPEVDDEGGMSEYRYGPPGEWQ